MRDDLGTHLKTLRLSMIELINKDYEDFVNLSKDLVGLDNGITKIQIPLEQIKSEVLVRFKFYLVNWLNKSSQNN